MTNRTVSEHRLTASLRSMAVRNRARCHRFANLGENAEDSEL